MILLELEVKDFRNIAAARLEPSPGLNVLCGNNGQGKTNLLEAVWLLTGGKSFRGARDADLVRRGEGFSVLMARTADSQRQKALRLVIGSPESERPGRYIRVNGADRGRAGMAAGEFTAVVFAPEHLGLAKGSPAGRRRFLDAALCQLYPGYLSALRRYTRLVTQKNSLLKAFDKTPGAQGMLAVFDEQLAGCGALVTQRRAEYLAKLKPLAEQNYAEISKNSEGMALCYRPAFEPSLGEEGLRQAIRAVHAAERRAGCCLAGPHREDFSISIAGQDARAFASQGQQRSAVLSLKLAEAACAAQITGEHPVLLLDDVLSELDAIRQEYLLTHVEGRQTFVTACDPAAFLHTDGRVYTLQNGGVSLRQE